MYYKYIYLKTEIYIKTILSLKYLWKSKDLCVQKLIISLIYKEVVKDSNFHTNQCNMIYGTALI